MDLNIAFYVSGKATRLKKILLNKKSVDLIKSTKLVVCDNVSNSELKRLLSDYNITYKEIDYKRLNANKSKCLSNIILSFFTNYNIDYCFCYGEHILEGKLLKLYKNKIINFHPSLLPLFKGKYAIDQAIKKGAVILGNTAHFLTEKVDGGPIVMQSIIHANAFFNGGYDKVLDLQIDMNIQIFNWLSEGRIKFDNNGDVKINETDFSAVSFYPKLEL